MRPDKHKQREKTLRKLARIQYLMWNPKSIRFRYSMREDVQYEWVPVEKPSLIGYRLYYYYADSDMNMKDMKQAKQFIDLFGKSLFTKNKNVYQLVRKSKGRFRTYRELLISRFGHKVIETSPYDKQMLPEVPKTISEQAYNNLPESLKSYCHRVFSHVSWGGQTVYKYIITLDLDKYLRIGATKEYSTHKGIPKTDFWKKDAEIDDTLRQEMYWAKYRYKRSKSEKIYREKDLNKVKRQLDKEMMEEVLTYKDIEA